MQPRRKQSSYSSSSSSSSPKDAKPVVVLTPTFYDEEEFLATKTPIDSRPTTTKLTLNWTFSLREVLESAEQGKSIKKRLEELVENDQVFTDQVPKPFDRRNSYITRISFDGFYNESLVSFFAGFSEFERLVYNYVRLYNPSILDKDVVDRLKDADKDFFSLRILPSKIVDSEGRIDDDDPMQRVHDELYAAGGVYEDLNPPQGICAHPSFRILETEIDLFKGVTEETVRNICTEVSARQVIVTPLSSLLANTMTIGQHVFAYNDKEGTQAFNVHSDMLAHIPTKYAAKLKTAIVARADVINRTCMHDIRTLCLSFLPTYINENWSTVEGNKDERLHVQTGKVFHLDDRFNVRIALSIDSIYVASGKTTGAFMLNKAPLVFKEVWHQRDVNRRTGEIHRDAKRCYSANGIDDNDVKGQAKHTIVRDEEDTSYAASSVPVTADDD